MSVTDLDRRLGGPIGTRARRTGIWFDAGPWALLLAMITWLICIWHQHPCQQTVAGKPVNALRRLCYSDIPIYYQNSGLGVGGMPYKNVVSDYPPLIVAFQLVARALSRWFGWPAELGVTQQQLLDGAYGWFLVSAVLLFVAFVALVGAHLLMGRDSTTGRRDRRVRSFDALWLAGAPIVAASGLVNWDLLVAAFVGVAMLLWATRRPVGAGFVFGLALSGKLYPVLVLAAIVLLAARAGQIATAGKTVLIAVLTWLVVNVPIASYSFTGWRHYWGGWFKQPADLGSVWYIPSDLGRPLPLLWLVTILVFVACCALIVVRTLNAPRRPRVAQVAFLLVAAAILCDKGYSPQHVFWVLPLLLLARPDVTDWAIFNIAELLYFWAVWAHLNGSSASTTGGRDVVYYVAILLHYGALIIIAVRVFQDMARPWDDPVREPYVDDPTGGVLDHQPDAPWMFGLGGDDSGIEMLDDPEGAEPWRDAVRH